MNLSSSDVTRIAPAKNFQNPLGLVLRMLGSGQRAAYSALVREALRLAAIPMDCLWQRAERRIVADNPTKHPAMLVVGAPRGGTTLVYQALARYLNVAYPTNLSALFPKSPITATRKLGWLLHRLSPDFHNFYGQTARLSGPNDAFFLWDRWFGEDRYNAGVSLGETGTREMQQFLASWCNTFDKPFLNKNNRNTTCTALLARSLPNAYFVVVRRNPFFVAQSLIRARAEVQGSKSVGWGLRSRESQSLTDPLGYVDDVCNQLVQIEEELQRGLGEIGPVRVVELTYEEFCADPEAALARIVSAIPGITLNKQVVRDELRPFQLSATVTLTDDERERVESYFPTSGAESHDRTHVSCSGQFSLC